MTSSRSSETNHNVGFHDWIRGEMDPTIHWYFKTISLTQPSQQYAYGSNRWNATGGILSIFTKRWNSTSSIIRIYQRGVGIFHILRFVICHLAKNISFRNDSPSFTEYNISDYLKRESRKVKGKKGNRTGYLETKWSTNTRAITIPQITIWN